ncbi:MAG: ribonuclease HII [Acidobacteriota bacterium]
MAQLLAEAHRLSLLRGLEGLLANAGFRAIAGVDEAGRGCLAGPVTAAAVIPDPRGAVPGVDDSKALSAAARSRLAGAIRGSALAWSVVQIPAAVIDRINILQATKRAMTEALAVLDPSPDCAVIDAVRLSGAHCRCLPVVRGDAMSYAVASASILAKEARDRYMLELHQRYPHYGFDSNKGYGAAAHREALRSYGPSPEHRLTFRSVMPRREGAPC